ncbi:MAG: hypothetical protein JWN87_2633 [Frankiales bacterium]|nr:hypothetical protein [Frankiales bacterium]
MAYNKPGFVVRKVVNRLALRFGLGQSVELVVTRRTSGEPQRLPVTPLDLDGTRYLVSVRGDAEWVRNLEAAGRRGALVEKGVRRDFLATALPVEERGPVIAAYRAKAGRGVDPVWNKLPDDQDHPVYALAFG